MLWQRFSFKGLRSVTNWRMGPAYARSVTCESGYENRRLGLVMLIHGQAGQADTHVVVDIEDLVQAGD